MSFLNPVNEPVLRFKSTDADAPQINYNSRTAGDVKAVLKACLVTGYGATAGAGWTTVNEVDNVCEFVSPSAAMSDFKLQVDDSSTSTTTFNYIKAAAAALITSNKKTSSYTETGVDTGWHLLVSDSGIVFAEIVYHKSAKIPIGRLTYYGVIKSALAINTGNSFMAWAAGWGATLARATYLFRDGYYTSRPMFLSDYNRHEFMTANQTILASESSKTNQLSVIDMWSEVFITDKKFVMAKLPALLFGAVADDAFTVKEANINSRTALQFYLCEDATSASMVLTHGFNVAIYTDYWEC